MLLDPFYQKLVAEFVSALVPVQAMLVACFIIALISEMRGYLSHKLIQAPIQTAEHWAPIGMFAAQQYVASADRGAKKAWAINWIQSQTAQHGRVADVGQIAELIEPIISQAKLDLTMVNPTDLATLEPVEPVAATAAASAPVPVPAPAG